MKKRRQSAKELGKANVNVNSERQSSDQESTHAVAVGNSSNEKCVAKSSESKKQLNVSTKGQHVKEHTYTFTGKANEIIHSTYLRESLEHVGSTEDITQLCSHVKKLANIAEDLSRQVATIQTQMANFWKDIELYIVFEELVHTEGNNIKNSERQNDTDEKETDKEKRYKPVAVHAHVKGNVIPIEKFAIPNIESSYFSTPNTSPSITHSTSDTSKQFSKSMTQKIKQIAQKRSQEMEKRSADKQGNVVEKIQKTMSFPRISSGNLTRNNITSTVNKEFKDDNKVVRLGNLNKAQYKEKYKQLQKNRPVETSADSAQKDETLEKPHIKKDLVHNFKF